MRADLTLAVALAIYMLLIGVVSRILRGVRVPESMTLFWSFLIFGAAAGVLMVLLWPIDTSVYPNVLAGLLGDWIYVRAIDFFGDPHSDHAHMTIPWLLRVPQVYAVTSSTGCGALGVAAQWLSNRTVGRRRKTKKVGRRAPA